VSFNATDCTVALTRRQEEAPALMDAHQYEVSSQFEDGRHKGTHVLQRSSRFFIKSHRSDAVPLGPLVYQDKNTANAHDSVFWDFVLKVTYIGERA
jgi:hypothetical protein